MHFRQLTSLSLTREMKRERFPIFASTSPVSTVQDGERTTYGVLYVNKHNTQWTKLLILTLVLWRILRESLSRDLPIVT